MARMSGRGLLLGRVEFSGIGGFQERFVSELHDSGIHLHRVSINGGRISGTISPFHYRTAAVTARKYGVQIRAGKRSGIYFAAHRYKERIGLYIGLLLFLVILSIGKSTVSDIRITGDAPKAQIIQILEECGITRGVQSHGLDFSLAERRIMLEVDNVAWVDVSLSGCRVSVTVEGATPAPEITDISAPCNIIAARDAKIIDTVVRRGTLVTAAGSGVSRGSLIVSGVIADGGGNLLYRHASADIIGEFTESREFFVPYSETIKTPDGEKTEFRYLVLGDDIYPLFFGRAYVGDALYTEQTEMLPFLGGTPLRIKTGIFTKYRSIQITRSADDCLAELKRQRIAFEENFFSEYEIVTAEQTCIPEDEGLRLTVVYTLRGNIAAEQPIEVTPAT